MNKPTNPVDLNTATARGLTKLPGVGRVLAKRIIAARPFSRAEDLTQVQGISLEMIEAWGDLYRISTTPEEAVPSPEEPTHMRLPDLESELEGEEESIPEVPGLDTGTDDTADEPGEAMFEEPAPMLIEEIEESPVEETVSTPEETVEDAIPLPDGEGEVAESAPPPAETEPAPSPAGKPGAETRGPEIIRPQPMVHVPAPAADAAQKYFSRRAIILMLVLSTLFGAALATVITLSTIALANNGNLRFANPARVEQVQSAVSIQESINTIQDEEITGLRRRLDNLDTLGARVSSVEADLESQEGVISSLGSQVDELNTEIAALQAENAALENEILSLQENQQRSTDLFTGFRDLLNDLFPTEDSK